MGNSVLKQQVRQLIVDSVVDDAMRKTLRMGKSFTRYTVGWELVRAWFAFDQFDWSSGAPEVGSNNFLHTNNTTKMGCR